MSESREIGIMDKRRSNAMKKEFLEKDTYDHPLELRLKRGKKPVSYYGYPTIIRKDPFKVKGVTISLVTVMWGLTKDRSIFFTIPLPANMNLDNIMTPVKFMETLKGYKTAINVVMGGLVLLNIVDFAIFSMGTEIGLDVLNTLPFGLAIGGVVALIVTMALYNKTHWTRTLSLESIDPKNESGLYHFCYAVDCDIPVPTQLAWMENSRELAKEAIKQCGDALHEHTLSLYEEIGERESRIDDILSDRRDSDIMKANTQPSAVRSQSLLGNPVVQAGLVVGLIATISAIIFLLTRAPL